MLAAVPHLCYKVRMDTETTANNTKSSVTDGEPKTKVTLTKRESTLKVEVFFPDISSKHGKAEANSFLRLLHSWELPVDDVDSAKP